MSKWGFAGCPSCREPLISTFEVRKKEFVCVVCGDYFEFLSPVRLGESPEIEARYNALKAQFDAGVRVGAK
jgi:hypothetical protein